MWINVQHGWVREHEEGAEVIILERDSDHWNKKVIRRKIVNWEEENSYLKDMNLLKEEQIARYIFHYNEEPENDLHLAFVLADNDFECDYYDNLTQKEAEDMLKRFGIP